MVMALVTTSRHNAKVCEINEKYQRKILTEAEKTYKGLTIRFDTGSFTSATRAAIFYEFDKREHGKSYKVLVYITLH